MYRLIAFKTMKKVIFSFVVVAAIAISAVVVTSCGNTQAQGVGSAQSVRWEYQSLNLGCSPGEDFNVRLNSLGTEGWELVSVSGNGTYCDWVAFFKRRLP